jgi:hypothetical protein
MLFLRISLIMRRSLSYALLNAGGDSACLRGAGRGG